MSTYNDVVREVDLAFWMFLLAAESWAIAFYLAPGLFPVIAGVANLLLAIFFAFRR